jgi:hypothetical protein
VHELSLLSRGDRRESNSRTQTRIRVLDDRASKFLCQRHVSRRAKPKPKAKSIRATLGHLE